MMVTIGNFLFHYRNGLFPLACLLVLIPGADLFDDPLDAASLGFVTSMFGQFVRIVTIGYEYIVRGGKNRRVYAENLVTEGIYRLCRNPMYVGNLLILVGVAIASNSWTCMAIAVPLFVFVYIAIVAAEENFLRGKFGAAFDQYTADVPRWLPRLGGLADAVGHGRFHWRRVLVKEYGTPFGWMTMMLALSLWQLWQAETLDEREDEVQVLLIAFAVLVACYVVIRILKKTKRLVAD